MSNVRLFVATALLSLAAPFQISSQPALRDPYEILQNNIKASGGIELLRADEDRYFEGTMAVGGLSGSLKVWNQKPDLSRTELDLKVFKMTEGISAELEWSLDANGKVQKKSKPDEVAVKRREVRRRLADYQFADPKADFFVVTAGGIEKVNDTNCYVIKISNKLNSDTRTDYINARTFLTEQSILVEGEVQTTIVFSDYRSVNGLMVPYHIKQTDRQTGQTQEIKISKYESHPAIDTHLFDPPAETAADFHFTRGSSAENIKFQFRGNHLYLPVMVKCKERWWILDTGAEMSVISKEFAQELGLEISGSMAGKGAGGAVDIAFTTLPPYSLPGIDFDQQKVAVFDMTDLNRLLDIKACGILGFDFLSRFVTRLDYANENLSIYDPTSFNYTGSGKVVDAHMKNNMFIVPATLDCNLSGSWLVDVGASFTSLNGDWALRHGFQNRPGVERMGRGAGAEFLTKSVRCKTVSFAGLTMDNPIVNFSSTGSDTTSVSDEIGTLGNSTFQNLIMYCDYSKERLIVEPGHNFNKPAMEDHSGLQLTRTANDDIQVWFAAPGTPAAKAGFEKGDLIKSINGVDPKSLEGLVAIRSLLCSSPGTTYTIVIDRNAATKTLTLKLASLL